MNKTKMLKGYDISQGNISITMRYNELQQLMLDCAKQGVEEYVKSQNFIMTEIMLSMSMITES